MNIADIKTKLEHVGLPLHGTDEELVKRAELNGLLEKQGEIKADSAVKVIANAERRKMGRPKKGKRN